MRAWWLACLGWVLCLAGLPLSHAQDVLSGGQLHAAAAPPPVRLAGSNVALPLHGRSRFWIDDSAMKSVEEIESAGDTLPWAPREPDQQYRVDGKALWIQFDAHGAGHARWFLEIASSGVDRVQFFHRNETGGWVRQEAGDSRPVSQWPLPGRVPTFELSHHDNGSPVRYYLRIEHDRVNFAAPIALYDQARLFSLREREQFMLGAYFGLAALMAIVAVANAIAYRDRTFGTYALYVALLGVGQAAYLGVGAQHLWDTWLKWNEVATFLLPGLSSAAGLWFVHTATEPARFSRVLDLMVRILIGALLLAVTADTIFESRPTFGFVMALTFVALLSIVALIGIVWSRGDDPTIRLIALGFLPVLVMAIFPLARGLNLIPGSALTRYGLTIGAMLEMPILFYALAMRGSRRREAQARAAALSHSDALTGLSNLRTLMQRLEASLARAHSQRHACALLTVRIANFESIVSEFGREVAEKALVVAAFLLRRAVRDVDIAARTGDHEFSLLLDGPTSPTEAVSCAQQIVASGLRQAGSLPQGLTIRFHVAVAMLPDNARDAQASHRWAASGLKSMPGDTRKPIRSMNF